MSYIQHECELQQRSHCKTKIKVDLGDQIVGNSNVGNTHSPSALKVEVTKVNCLYLLHLIYCFFYYCPCSQELFFIEF